MKKLALSVILGASLMVTPSAFALKAMSDTNMKSATGQAGVTIAIDDVTLYQQIGTTIYRDTDGLTGAGDAAGISISGAETLTTIRAIIDGDNRGGFLQNDYTHMMNATAGTDYEGTRTGLDANGVAFELLTGKALTIDVARKAQIMSAGKKFNVDVEFGTLDANGDPQAADPALLGAALAEKAIQGKYNEALLLNPAMTYAQFLTAATTDGTEAALISAMETAMDTDSGGAITSFTAYATMMYSDFAVSGVVIGLPTIEIVKNGAVKTIGITTAGNSFNNNKSFITTKKTDSTLAILGGTLEIVAH